MDKLGLEEDVPLEHSWVNKAIENAQTKVEAYNFDIRKHVVEYDDVMNKQREVIYADRRKVLAEENLRPMIEDWIREEIESLIASHVAGENIDEWDFDGLETALRQMIPLPASLTAEELKEQPADELVEMLAELASEAYDERERRFGPEAMRLLERTWLLRVIDDLWIQHLTEIATNVYAEREERFGAGPMRALERWLMISTIDQLWIQHLTAIDDVREGIGLRAYGQRDPLIEYKVEAADMFDNLLAAIHHDVVYAIFRVEIRQEPTRRPPQQMTTNREDGAARQPVRAGRKVGRNEPCPCGSGQKYKKCHGR
jgi:preprotein translocase subunit SecA